MLVDVIFFCAALITWTPDFSVGMNVTLFEVSDPLSTKTTKVLELTIFVSTGNCFVYEWICLPAARGAGNSWTTEFVTGADLRRGHDAT